MNGACIGNFFGAPPPGALGRGQTVKCHLISITKQFQRFLYQTLCVLTNESFKHIRRDFHSVAWVPQGWDFGVLGVPRWSKKMFFKHGHVAYQNDKDDEQKRMQVKFSS